MKKYCIILLVLLIAVIAVGVGSYMWMQSQQATRLHSTYATSPAGYVLHSQAYSAALTDFNAGDYTKAYPEFAVLAAAESDPQVRQTLELFAADALASFDAGKGVAAYHDFYTTTTNDSINRAVALLKVLMIAMTQKNESYLQPFLDASASTTMATSTRHYEINEKIYALHPLCTATTDIARFEIATATSTAQASAIWSKYADQISLGEREMSASAGLQYLAANCILHEYYLSWQLEKFGLTTPNQSGQLIELASTTANKWSSQLTQQFIAIDYANYQVKIGKADDAYATLITLDAQGVLPEIKLFLSTTASHVSYVYLYQESKKDARFTQWFHRFGW